MSNNILSQFPEENNDYRRGIGYYLPLIIMAVIFIIGFAFIGYFTMNLIDDMLSEPETFGEPIVIIEEPEITQEVIEEPVAEIVEEVEEEEPEVYVHMTDDDLIAQVIMHEAGNQEMVGKVAVAMTILNRCDYFGLTVEQVVTAPSAYAYPYTGVITHDCYRAIEIARKNRDLFPADMMYFLPNGYHDFGEHYIQIQDHYFTTQETKTIKAMANGE